MTPPIHVLPLFPVLDRLLGELLRSLAPADWQRPTLARRWTVHDVAAHLLDGNLRLLSILRDGYVGDPPGELAGYADLVGYLNRLNAEWVQASRRLSPAVLTDLLESTGRDYCAYLATLDPWAPAALSVAWAGETESPNWFHLARDYTEKWHHQQQIREAVGQPEPLLAPELLRPLFATFVRGLPHAYRAVPAAPSTVVHLTIPSAGGGSWWLVREATSWRLSQAAPALPPAASVSLPPEVAWQLFTKALRPAAARTRATITGDEKLAEACLSLVAVIA